MSVTVERTVTLEDIVEALAHMKHRASREIHVVGETCRADGVVYRTPWDKRHAALNNLLDAWQDAR